MPDTSLRFAAIADDYTGASDLAGMLHAGGVPTVQMFGVPDGAIDHSTVSRGGAIVVALKTRSVEPAAAVDASLQALRHLLPLRPRQIQFKYCSTFDSTPRGNIGPVTEALLRALGADCAVAVPALPVNGRTQYMGHLFVQDRLLSESPLRDHPLNPMSDSNLVRWLGLQTSLPVGLIPLPAVMQGPEAIRVELQRQRDKGARIVLIDAVSDADLDAIAAVVCDLPLITGGSGLAQPLARIWNREDVGPPVRRAMPSPDPALGTLILAGSCSAATLQQLGRWQATGGRILRVSEPDQIAAAFAEVRREIGRTGVAAVASSALPAERSGGCGAAAAFEAAFGDLAAAVTDAGLASHLIVAGGETSGAVVDRLGVKAARVAGIVAPGVPSLVSLDARRLCLVLKSGNFGGPDFFADAIRHRELLST
ncbi:MAG: 3-oxo-tetronate kinase [Bryobacteraceae bacterium]|nr:3-oxo-tetronate kinase [Bryobacteraceae bacterium]